MSFMPPKSKFAILLAFILFVPTAAHACEPVPVLMLTMMSSATTVAIVLNSAIAMVAVVFVKSLLFARKSPLKPRSAFFYMVAANVFSTIPGLFCAAMVSSTTLLLTAWIPLFIAFVIPSNRIAKHLNKIFMESFVVNVCFILATYASAFLFFQARSAAIDDYYGTYWFLKTLYVTLGVAIGLGITIGYEEAFVSMLSRRLAKRDESFMDSVTWANVWTAMIFALIGAGIALPQRFASPDFLILQKLISKLFA